METDLAMDHVPIPENDFFCCFQFIYLFILMLVYYRNVFQYFWRIAIDNMYLNNILLNREYLWEKYKFL